MALSLFPDQVLSQLSLQLSYQQVLVTAQLWVLLYMDLAIWCDLLERLELLTRLVLNRLDCLLSFLFLLCPLLFVNRISRLVRVAIV